MGGLATGRSPVQGVLPYLYALVLETFHMNILDEQRTVLSDLRRKDYFVKLRNLPDDDHTRSKHVVEVTFINIPA
jgi:hypothetical protein